MPFNQVMVTTNARAGTAMALVSMLCVQTGLAVAIGLFDRIGVEGAVWLRLVWAALLLLVIARGPGWLSLDALTGFDRPRR